jgi:hypothetical protein
MQKSNVEPLTSNKNNNFSLRFADTIVLDTETNSDVSFKSLWENAEDDVDIVLVHFFRRFG